MMKSIVLAFAGFASGAIVSAGVFAFIAAIGLVPRMAFRSKTKNYIRFYEDVIVLGGLFGAVASFVSYHLPAIPLLVAVFAICIGTFIGVLAVSLSEVLNVMPILFRRTHLTIGLPYLLLAFTIGKMFGSLLYFLQGGFFIP
ncbi:stage V sporulation protein AB [Chakrabartyella piscis]|uniref:stage V sporulation protein AB n=1 Tax=Chakrabartyella piscis TaxID=2918914 RepID=UPI002958CA4C|nr:stage V sporulation protein AB [Chakrabartyella piscis]